MSCKRYMRLLSQMYFIAIFVLLFLIKFLDLRITMDMIVLGVIPYELCILRTAYEKGINYSLNELVRKDYITGLQELIVGIIGCILIITYYFVKH